MAVEELAALSWMLSKRLLPEAVEDPLKVTRNKALEAPSKAVILLNATVAKLLGMFEMTSIAIQFDPFVLYSHEFVENPVVVFCME
ncbi:MAG: hypothetical protein EBT95_08830 [Verrucomicrobia bacterium]|nr:hypothetical protein [Verrucomicrobiota bacterium]